MNHPVAEGLVWLIFFLPVASFFVIAVALRGIGRWPPPCSPSARSAPG